MIYTANDVANLLASLEPPFENETVELKEAKSSFKFNDIGRYFSALSNEALLSGRDSGWLFFGVDDSGVPVGTGYRAGEPKALQGLKRDIASHVTNRMTFREVFDFEIAGKRVVAFQIPAATPGLPCAFNNAAWAREGDSLVPLPIDKYEEIRQMRRPDWSAIPVAGATVDHLDPRAVGRAVELFLNKHSGHREAFGGMDDLALLDKACVTKGGLITPTSLILLGKPESLRLLEGVAPRITWTLYASDGTVVSYEHFDPPFLLAVDEVLAKIRNERYRIFPDGGSLFPVEMTQYEPEVIRELLHNCIAHQDYSLQGRVNVEEFEDRLVFVNEGSFIPGDIKKAMRPGYKPPFYRNLMLCEAMVQLDMIDTIAMGIPKMFQMQRKRYFPLPTYDLSDPGRVSVSIYGKSIDAGYGRLLFARPDLPLDTVYLLDKVQKHEGVTKEEAALLHEQRLVEGRYPQLTIAGDIAAKAGAASGYVRSRGLNDEACKGLILQMLRETGPASRSSIASMLEDLLPSAMSDRQKSRKVSNLLATMKNTDRTVVCEGNGRASTWRLSGETA